MTSPTSSFQWADNRPYKFTNYREAAIKAEQKVTAKSISKDPDAILKDFLAQKRKYAKERPLRKRAKRLSLADTTISSTSTESEINQSNEINGDDTDWSECDELELSRNISILEQKISPKKARLNLHESEAAIKQQVPTTSSDNDVDDDVDWSDCDELELSRNISLLEQSISSSVSKQDRSALQEISNL